MRLINADALKEKINTTFWSEIGAIIDNAPTIDAVEVVRCKDCRWYEPKYKDKEYDCPQGLYAVYENDFCSHGERREP